jgi:hypothetical protein
MMLEMEPNLMSKAAKDGESTATGIDFGLRTSPRAKAERIAKSNE